MAKARVIQAVETDSNRIFAVGKDTSEYGIGLNGVVTDIIEEDGHVWIFDENDEIIVEIKNAPIIIYYADAPEENANDQLCES